MRGTWLRHLQRGEEIAFRDTRQSRRVLHVADTIDNGAWAECRQTAYVAPGVVLRRRAGGGRAATKCPVGDLPSQEQPIVLHIGDTLILTRELRPGHPAIFDTEGRLVAPATIGCTLTEIFADVRPGERIWLDDGKIGGIIRAAGADEIRVEVTQARAKGEKLRADKGINVPDSTLHLPALTLRDRQDLPFVTKHADIIGYSFVRSSQDVAALQAGLADLGASHLGIVLKIETRAAFEALPGLLLAAMRSPCAGVMIARGDLAVECGYERLAELQEEILCIAEAAHMPVIWATQVLERLAEEGIPSRAEISDAAMGERAECVMMNKGPYIVEAVGVLDGILQRMEGHQSKKRAMLRRLRLASSLRLPDRAMLPPRPQSNGGG
jgi:pyruvate kinase